MKFFTKKRIAFVLTIAAVLALAQCDLLRVWGSQDIGNHPEIDFPMGEGKQISYPVRSWIDKPYAMLLVIEHINYKKSIDDDVNKEIPFSFSATCYRIENGKETVFFQRQYSKEDELYMGSGWIPEKPYSPDSRAGTGALGGLRLPYGNYRCDFKDTSTPEIKDYLKKAGVVRTFIVIWPSAPFLR